MNRLEDGFGRVSKSFLSSETDLGAEIGLEVSGCGFVFMISPCIIRGYKIYHSST